MARQPAADPREATARLEKELLARLGLGTGASNEQVENAHEELAAYLDKAPSALQDWANRQSAGIDEAYALLRGSRDDLTAAALARAAAPATAAAPVAPAPAPAAVPQATPRAATPGVVLPHGGRHNMDALDSDSTWYDEADLQPRSSTTRHAREARAAAAAQQGGINPTLKRAGLALGALVLGAGVLFGVYNLGVSKAPAGPTASAAADGSVDLQAEVARLMQLLAANPNDTKTLLDLGTVYYQAGDYATSITWINKLLAVDPKNVNGMLALGAAKYNLADYTTAESTWQQVLAIDPNNMEAYYDLGFLYFSDNPPNIEKTREMWNKVVEIAPDSDVAKTVKSHLDSLTASASGSPAASAATSPVPSAAASAAASAAPSAAASKAPGPTASPAPSSK